MEYVAETVIGIILLLILAIIFGPMLAVLLAGIALLVMVIVFLPLLLLLSPFIFFFGCIAAAIYFLFL